jgi:hypothetical protein
MEEGSKWECDGTWTFVESGFEKTATELTLTAVCEYSSCRARQRCDAISAPVQLISTQGIVQLRLAYYEIEVLALDDDVFASVGFSSAAFPLSDILVGWDAESYGLYSDGGSLHGSPRLSVGSTSGFGVGDVIGCGIVFAKTGGSTACGGGQLPAHIFTTINGDFVGDAVFAVNRLVADALFPTFSATGSCAVRARFSHFAYGGKKVLKTVHSLVVASAAAVPLVRNASAELASEDESQSGERLPHLPPPPPPPKGAAASVVASGGRRRLLEETWRRRQRGGAHDTSSPRPPSAKQSRHSTLAIDGTVRTTVVGSTVGSTVSSTAEQCRQKGKRKKSKKGRKHRPLPPPLPEPEQGEEQRQPQTIQGQQGQQHSNGGLGTTAATRALRRGGGDPSAALETLLSRPQDSCQELELEPTPALPAPAQEEETSTASAESWSCDEVARWVESLDPVVSRKAKSVDSGSASILQDKDSVWRVYARSFAAVGICGFQLVHDLQDEDLACDLAMGVRLHRVRVLRSRDALRLGMGLSAQKTGSRYSGSASASASAESSASAKPQRTMMTTSGVLNAVASEMAAVASATSEQQHAYAAPPPSDGFDVVGSEEEEEERDDDTVYVDMGDVASALGAVKPLLPRGGGGGGSAAAHFPRIEWRELVLYESVAQVSQLLSLSPRYNSHLTALSSSSRGPDPLLRYVSPNARSGLLRQRSPRRVPPLHRGGQNARDGECERHGSSAGGCDRRACGAARQRAALLRCVHRRIVGPPLPR